MNIMYKARKISLYTGMGLCAWVDFGVDLEKAKKFISCNDSASGAFYWILKSYTK